MISEIKEYIELILVIIGLISAVVGLLIGLTKSEKGKAKLSKVLFYTNKISDLVVEAEKFIDLDGSAKKDYVLLAFEKLAEENGVEFDIKVADEIIEQVIDLSKKVNFPKKK